MAASYKEIMIGPRNFTIPIDWELLDIENTSTLKGRIGWQGLTTKEYLNKGKFYLITGTNFKDGRIYWDNCHYVEKERYQQDSNIQIKEKDVLITKDGTIGKVALIDKSPPYPATLNSGVFVLRPIENSYLPEYMYHYLKSYFFNSFINDIKAGSTIAHLYQKDFNKFQFICPPTIEEQHKIAKILSTVDETIEKTNAIIEEARQLKKGLMQKLFTEGIGHTKFKETKLGKDCNIFMCKRIFSHQTNKNEEIPFYKIGTIGSIADSFISRELFNEFKRKYRYPKNGEIMITCSGTVGKCIIYNGEDAYYQDSNIVWIDNPKQNITNEFLYFFLKNINWGRLNRTTIVRLYNSDLKNLKIKYPNSKDEQNKIVKILTEVDAKIEKEEATKAELEQLKKGLMQVLLTGKVRVKA